MNSDVLQPTLMTHGDGDVTTGLTRSLTVSATVLVALVLALAVWSYQTGETGFAIPATGQCLRAGACFSAAMTQSIVRRRLGRRMGIAPALFVSLGAIFLALGLLHGGASS